MFTEAAKVDPRSLQCAACPLRMPPCAGVDDRARCQEVIAAYPARRSAGRARGSVPLRRDGRVRVGFWSPVCFAAGGTEIWHETLLPRLDRDRVDVVGSAIIDARGVAPAMAERWARHAPVSLGTRALADLAARVDVLVAWGIARPSDFLPKGRRRPFVVMVTHGDCGSRWSVDIMAKAEPDVDQYVAVAPAALGTIPEGRRGQAITLTNGVDPGRLQPRRSREEVWGDWNVVPGQKVLLQVCRLSDEKDPYALARAVSALPPEWIGVAVGDGIHAQSVRDHAGQVALYRVRYPGIMDDVGSALAAADVLLAASTTEGFGLSAMEGAWAGLPVVSTAVGAVLDRPDAFTIVPAEADAATLACAVQRARPRGVDLSEYHADAFGRRWSDFLATVGTAARRARKPRGSLADAVALHLRGDDRSRIQPARP